MDADDQTQLIEKRFQDGAEPIAEKACTLLERTREVDTAKQERDRKPEFRYDVDLGGRDTYRRHPVGRVLDRQLDHRSIAAS